MIVEALPTTQMTEKQAIALEAFIKVARNLLVRAEKHHDPALADLAIQRLQTNQKRWVLAKFNRH